MRPMKDGLARPALERLARNLARADATFDERRFVERAELGLEDLELKERVTHVIGTLTELLPEDFSEACRLLRRAATQWDHGDPNDALRGFAAWPIIDYVAARGIDDFEESMETLRCLTGLFTAEFAIRPFLSRYPERTFARLHEWIDDPDPAVRRLCSEGLRPLLPWGSRVEYLTNNPTRIVDVLDRLAYDGDVIVRRSVANNLNDLSKRHPDLVIQTCLRWRKRAPAPFHVETDKLIRHSLRSLIKAGHEGALTLLGAQAGAAVSLEKLAVSPKRLVLGGQLRLDVCLRSKSKTPQTLIVDFAIHHQKADKKTRAKVFKLKTLQLAGKQQVNLTKTHSIRPITTRKYYPGVHEVELLVNGIVTGRGRFMLVVPKSKS